MKVINQTHKDDITVLELDYIDNKLNSKILIGGKQYNANLFLGRGNNKKLIWLNDKTNANLIGCEVEIV